MAYASVSSGKKRSCLVDLFVEVEGAECVLTDNQLLATCKIWFWVLRLVQAWKSPIGSILKGLKRRLSSNCSKVKGKDLLGNQTPHGNTTHN